MSEENKQRLKDFCLFFFIWYKMEQKALSFGEDCINENDFHKNGKPISTDEVNIKKIVLSSKHSYGNKGSFKYFIGYINIGNLFPVPLYINLPQMNGYTKYFDINNKYKIYIEIPKDNEYCTCLSEILLDSIFANSDKEYYPQIFLEECKYAIKKKKIINTINEELKLSESDDEYDDSYEKINEY